MLTPRGWWFLVLVITVGAIGAVLALRGSPALLLVSVTLVAWIGAEGALLAYRARVVARRWLMSREVLDEHGPVRTLWAGKSYRIRLDVSLQSGRLNFAALRDREPVGARVEEGDRSWEGLLSPSRRAHIEYTIRPDRPGVVRFEGVGLRLADLQGFFFAGLFMPEPVELLVLPVMAAGRLSRRADKQFNMLPPPGLHRHRRPGSGSELLELRDYRPGDPPRRIAWKVSARREQLITREYESEVPLRCTLLLDASNATRLGPPGRTALASLADIAATVAQAAIGNRDLVGLTVCDGDSVEVRRPARTPLQLVTLLEMVARAAPLMPLVDGVASDKLLPAARSLAEEVYPELMRPSLNRYPAWVPWLSAPPPAPADGHSRWTGALTRWRKVFSATYRGRAAVCKRLAALIAAKYALPVGATALLAEDDAALSLWLQRFLAEHRVPYDVPVYDSAGNDRFVGVEPLAQQARALNLAVSRGRDNELFVLMGEYALRVGGLDELLKAVRRARARHHQVLVVQPGRKPVEPPTPPAGSPAEALIEFAGQARQARQWAELRRAFGRLGVPVLPAGEGDPARLILHRLEQLRAAQGTGRL